MNTKEAFKKEVYDINANRIGEIADLIFDLPSGRISHLVVKTGMLKKRNVAIDLVAKSGDSVVLNVSKDELDGKTA